MLPSKVTPLSVIAAPPVEVICTLIVAEALVIWEALTAPKTGMEGFCPPSPGGVPPLSTTVPPFPQAIINTIKIVIRLAVASAIIFFKKVFIFNVLVSHPGSKVCPLWTDLNELFKLI
ncbi:MAG: hypothetical protein ACYC40_02650 [Patescibacteria group bacterium]